MLMLKLEGVKGKGFELKVEYEVGSGYCNGTLKRGSLGVSVIRHVGE